MMTAIPTDKPVPEKRQPAAVIDTEVSTFIPPPADAVDCFRHGPVQRPPASSAGNRRAAAFITAQLAQQHRSVSRHRTHPHDRKFLEIFLARRIEQAYTKEQILRYYLDRIYFGQGLYGAETTAYAFFGCSVQQLNLSQCALLAGMISSPNASSPWKDIDAAKAARSRALTRMVRANDITQAEADRAEKAPLSLRPRPDFGGGFATSEVRRQLEQTIDSRYHRGRRSQRFSTTIGGHLQNVAGNCARGYTSTKSRPQRANVTPMVLAIRIRDCRTKMSSKEPSLP